MRFFFFGQKMKWDFFWSKDEMWYCIIRSSWIYRKHTNESDEKLKIVKETQESMQLLRTKPNTPRWHKIPSINYCYSILNCLAHAMLIKVKIILHKRHSHVLFYSLIIFHVRHIQIIQRNLKSQLHLCTNYKCVFL